MALGTSVPPLAAVSSRTKRYLKTLQDPTLHSVFSLPARFNERLTLYAAVLLTALALAMDYRVVPLLYNGSTLWAMGILLVLVYRGKDRPADEAGATDLSPPSWGRLLAFGSLHALLLGVSRFGRTPLASAIAELPAHYRAVVVLHHVEGVSMAEVAASLGITIETAKSRAHRARLFLRQRLAGFMSGATSGVEMGSKDDEILLRLWPR